MDLHTKIEAFEVLGSLLLAFDLCIILTYRQRAAALSASISWWKAKRIGALIGLFLFLLTFWTFQSSPTLKIAGFPFFVGALELHEGHWRDFFGAITYWSIAGNFAVSMLTPQALLRLWCLKRTT